MRILFLSTVYPGPGAPTLGTFNRSRLEGLGSEDRVRVVAPVPWPRALRVRAGRLGGWRSQASSPANVEGVSYPTYYYPPKVLQWAYGRFMWQSVRRHVREVVRAFEPEAVLGYWTHPDGEAGLHAARLAGIPMGLIVGGSDLMLLTRDPARKRAIERVLREVDAVFPVGSALAQKARELGVPADRLHELRQGVDSDLFSPGDPAEARRRLGVEAGVPLLLYVGSLLPVKAPDLLLDAAARLSARGQDFRLWLVGDGPLRRSLVRRAKTLGLGARVRFLGALSHDQLPDHFRAAHLTVLSSRSEGVPNVLRESLACGTPFVATRVGGIADIATSDCELVNPGDPAALADALARRLAEPSVKRPVAPFTWKESAETIRRVLAQRIESRR